MVVSFARRKLDPQVETFIKLFLRGEKTPAINNLNKFMEQFSRSKFNRRLWLQYIQVGIANGCGFELKFTTEPRNDNIS